MDLSSTAYVVLGALDERPRSGYDIKQFADKSIRLFWAVGFGQLYPELKNLTEAGLIEAADASTGGRRRTVYHLTGLGREALADWVSDPGTPAQEVRDEALVKLFFSDVVEPPLRSGLARRIAERHAASRTTLRGYQETRPPGPELPMHQALLEFGIAYHTFMEQWFDRLAERVGEPGKESR